jgi:hypothetical protein
MLRTAVLSLIIVALIGGVSVPFSTTSASAQACAPSARLSLETIVVDASGGLGQLVTVAGSSPGLPLDLLNQVSFSSARNAAVVVNGQPLVPPASIPVSPPASSWQFLVRPVNADADWMVTFTVTDSCGSVPKFVGAGGGTLEANGSKAKPTRTPTQSPAATATRTPTQLPTATATRTPTPVVGGPATSPVNVSWFYSPPTDGTSVQTMAGAYASAILTRGHEAYRDQLRAAGMRGPILQYLMANETSGPPRAGGAGALRSSQDACSRSLEISYLLNTVTGIAGDFCTALHPVEANFLHNSAGERLYTTLSWQEQTGTKTGYIYSMNPAAPGWRAYLAQRARENLQSFGYDGLFLDNLDTSLHRLQHQEANSTGAVQEYATEASYRAATNGLLSAVRGQVGSGTIWANTVGAYELPSDEDGYLPYLDGVMREYFVDLWNGSYASPAVWEAQLQQAEKLSSQGKAFVGVAQGPRSDVARMRFGVASYLLIANARAFIRYADAGAYHQAWLYGEYQARLGSPTTARYQAGGLWRREFACGSVTVDPASRASTIAVDTSRPGCQ